MHVGVPSVIALLWVVLASCAGNEISPAEQSAAPAPGDGDPITALYAAPADVAFITVSDITANIVGPADVPFAATFYGYGYAAELVTPFETLDAALTAPDAISYVHAEVVAPFADLDNGTLPPPVLAGPEMVAPPANDADGDILSAPPDAK